MDRPSIFSAPMVRALLAGRKTQTRRLNDVNPITGKVSVSPLAKCQPGDRLWVRENIWQAHSYPCTLPSGDPEPTSWTRGNLIHYSADGTPPNTPNRHYPDGLRGRMFSAPDPYAVWLQRPSIHMPRWASRLTLVVTEMRHQRLQDITEDDALAEGIGGPSDVHRCSAFEVLWDSLHGAGSWAANPWVAAITFEVIKANIDAIPAAA